MCDGGFAPPFSPCIQWVVTGRLPVALHRCIRLCWVSVYFFLYFTSGVRSCRFRHTIVISLEISTMWASSPTALTGEPTRPNSGATLPIAQTLTAVYPPPTSWFSYLSSPPSIADLLRRYIRWCGSRRRGRRPSMAAATGIF